MSKIDKKISVIVPVFNEEQVILEFYDRMSGALKESVSSYEMIFVNDGSVDATLDKLKELHAKDKNIKIISFSRNFGHSMAISAGLAASTGDGVFILDADLQDPPELLPRFLDKWQDGHQIVYGIKTKRKEFFLKRFSYWLFYRLLARLSSLKIPLDAGDFSLLDRRVVDVINKLPERNRFLRGLRSWSGFRQHGIVFERAERYAGNTKYPLKKLLGLAGSGIFSFSYVPLRVASISGFIVASFSFVVGLLFLANRIFPSFGPTPPPGFASTMVAILFLGGIQLLTIGLLGEYVARIYEEVKQRPLYVIEEKIGFDK